MIQPRDQIEPSALSAILAIAAKDLRTETRSHLALATMGAFAAMMVFAHRSLAEELTPAQASLALWSTLLFTAFFGLFHSFASERDQKCLPVLLLAPCPREALLLGKIAANLVVMALVEAVLVLLFTLAYDQDFVGGGPGLAVLVLGTLGLVVTGTLLSALVSGRGDRLLLPLLMIPMVLFTLLLPALQLHQDALAGETLSMVRLTLLGLFDVIMLGVGLLLFEAVIES